MTPEEIERKLAMNQILLEQYAPSLLTTGMHDISGTVSGDIPSGSLPFGNGRQYMDKVLVPSIMETFKTNKEFDEYNDNAVMKAIDEYKKSFDEKRPYYKNNIGIPKTQKEIISPKQSV